MKKKPIEDDSSSESTEEDINVLLKGLAELNFKHPHIQKKVLQRDFRIWSNSQPTQTRVTKRKSSKLPALGPEGKASIEQAWQEISQAYKEATIEATSSSKKTKTVRFEIPKPIVTSQEEQEVIYNSPNVSPTTIEEEEPSTPTSPSKTPLVSTMTSPPKSPLVSLMQIPPPSPTKEPIPPIETTLEKSLPKKPHHPQSWQWSKPAITTKTLRLKKPRPKKKPHQPPPHQPSEKIGKEEIQD